MGREENQEIAALLVKFSASHPRAVELFASGHGESLIRIATSMQLLLGPEQGAIPRSELVVLLHETTRDADELALVARSSDEVDARLRALVVHLDRILDVHFRVHIAPGASARSAPATSPSGRAAARHADLLHELDHRKHLPRQWPALLGEVRRTWLVQIVVCVLAARAHDELRRRSTSLLHAAGLSVLSRLARAAAAAAPSLFHDSQIAQLLTCALRWADGRALRAALELATLLVADEVQREQPVERDARAEPPELREALRAAVGVERRLRAVATGEVGGREASSEAARELALAARRLMALLGFRLGSRGEAVALRAASAELARAHLAQLSPPELARAHAAARVIARYWHAHAMLGLFGQRRAHDLEAFAAVSIQKLVRAHLARAALSRRQRAAIAVGACARGMVARRCCAEATAAARASARGVVEGARPAAPDARSFLISLELVRAQKARDYGSRRKAVARLQALSRARAARNRVRALRANLQHAALEAAARARNRREAFATMRIGLYVRKHLDRVRARQERARAQVADAAARALQHRQALADLSARAPPSCPRELGTVPAPLWLGAPSASDWLASRVSSPPEPDRSRPELHGRAARASPDRRAPQPAASARGVAGRPRSPPSPTLGSGRPRSAAQARSLPRSTNVATLAIPPVEDAKTFYRAYRTARAAQEAVLGDLVEADGRRIAVWCEPWRGELRVPWDLLEETLRVSGGGDDALADARAAADASARQAEPERGAQPRESSGARARVKGQLDAEIERRLHRAIDERERQTLAGARSLPNSLRRALATAQMHSLALLRAAPRTQRLPAATAPPAAAVAIFSAPRIPRMALLAPSSGQRTPTRAEPRAVPAVSGAPATPAARALRPASAAARPTRGLAPVTSAPALRTARPASATRTGSAGRTRARSPEQGNEVPALSAAAVFAAMHRPYGGAAAAARARVAQGAGGELRKASARLSEGAPRDAHRLRLRGERTGVEPKAEHEPTLSETLRQRLANDAAASRDVELRGAALGVIGARRSPATADRSHELVAGSRMAFTASRSSATGRLRVGTRTSGVLRATTESSRDPLVRAR